MATRMAAGMRGLADRLRYEPTAKRVRAVLGGRTVADTRRAMLVWQPGRVLPCYAVPAEDVDGELESCGADEGEAVGAGTDGRELLDPRTGFGHHTCPGERLSMRAGSGGPSAAAFQPADPDLRGHVLLDFAAFDEWLEEDEPVLGGPRDPFHRVDLLAGSRRVTAELDGHRLAVTVRPLMVFETHLPACHYFPTDDVRPGVLSPSGTRTRCPYKGEAAYRSASVDGREVPDVAWAYDDPLSGAERLAGMLCFDTSKVTVAES